MTTISTLEAKNQSRAAKVGWGILLVMSTLLLLAGINWFITLPELALENIAERTSLEPAGFMMGEPSAFDVITLIARGYGAGYAALGLLALLVALEGYRNGTRWAWMAVWVLVAAYTALGAVFTWAAGGVNPMGLGILAFAVVALVGQMLARKGLVQ
jgi:hypothetical protein